mgnify:CR=1 FL=1
MDQHVSLFDNQSYDDLIGKTVHGYQKYGEIVSCKINNTSHAYTYYRLEVTFRSENTYCFRSAEEVLSKCIHYKEKL